MIVVFSSTHHLQVFFSITTSQGPRIKFMVFKANQGGTDLRTNAGQSNHSCDCKIDI